MTIIILPPAAELYLIDPAILADLLHEADPALEGRPEVWTRASIALVQPGLELLVAGFRRAWAGSPKARRAALRLLAGLTNDQVPSGRVRTLYLREMIEGFRLATRFYPGAVAAPLFASHMLDGVD